ncbi:GvpT/GvpP family gas vesicle accessory protein [Halalkalibacter kiskunsagensis]|uniref:GvpT/GvpP family gas vesicle accessory protein n=1 Tax=Halalkalibacter kiskunsagensis TaxID=1548599 RepID=A0ABV6KEM5_9BACI
MTVAEKKEQNEEIEQNEERKDDNHHSMNLAIIGGVVGAGIGLLSSPGTSKKVIRNISESEVMRVAGRELKRAAQEILTEQAVNSIRQTASGYMNKSGGGLLSLKKKHDENDEEDHSSDEDPSSHYEEIKEDNKQLNERLEKIENMLNKLADSKKS